MRFNAIDCTISGSPLSTLYVSTLDATFSDAGASC